MSLKNSIGGTARRCPRKPSSETERTQSRPKPMRKILIIVIADGHGLTPNLRQEFPGCFFGEPRINRLNDQKESVIGHAPKRVIVENRMVQPRQSVQHEHPKKGGKR